jgi:hypothetical protein
MSEEIVSSYIEDNCQACPALTWCRLRVNRAEKSTRYYTLFASAQIRALIDEGSAEGVDAATEIMVEPETFMEWYGKQDDDVETLQQLVDSIDEPVKPQAQDIVRELGEFIALESASIELDRSAISLTTEGCSGPLHQSTKPESGRSYGKTTITCQSPLEGAGGKSITFGG